MPLGVQSLRYLSGNPFIHKARIVMIRALLFCLESTKITEYVIL